MQVWLQLVREQELSGPGLPGPISHQAPLKGGSSALIGACVRLVASPGSRWGKQGNPREEGSLRLSTCWWELGCSPETATG